MSPPRLPIAGHRASLLMAVLFALLTLSLMTPLLIWVGLLSACAVLVRVALYHGWYHHAPSVRTVNLLAVLCALALAWFSTSLGLLLSMVNLLVMACALKLMMMTRRKDFLQLFVAMLFLIGCGFIFAQSYPALLFYMGLLGLALLSLYSAFAPSRPLIGAIKTLGIMFVQAAPVAVLLFVIMPQLPPLWKMPTSKSTQTGLSETVTPGDIAKLSQSDELAFTVTFSGRTPQPRQRYYRALTLEDFDGKTWSVSDVRRDLIRQQQRTGREFAPPLTSDFFSYEIIAEVTGQRWLYGIDIAEPANADSDKAIWRTHHYQLIAREPLMSKRAYQLRSYPNALLNQGHTSFDKALNRQLPDKGNQRTRDFVNALRQQTPDNRAFATAMMAFFADNPFRYTLEPPPMPDDPVDTFLFDEQAGFCSHYASALAFAFRQAGIPARLVTGYHGGEEIAPNVYTIRQYDAHAWVEAWLDESGWTRFDPTSVVAPDRLSLGLQQALEASGESLEGSAFTGLYQSDTFRQFRRFMANLDYLWSRWVLGFDASAQQNLFKLLLGELSPLKLTLFFLSILLVIALLLTLYFLPVWRRERLPDEVRLYHLAAAAVAEATGISREGKAAGVYFQQVAPLLPAVSLSKFEAITKHFESARYATTGSSRSHQQMKLDVKTLRKQLKRHKRDSQ